MMVLEQARFLKPADVFVFQALLPVLYLGFLLIIMTEIYLGGEVFLFSFLK